MSHDPRFDDMLFMILNHVGGIDKFLDVVFAFLYQRTDFFKVKKSGAEKLGLPPGVAQKMVKVISQKYVKLESIVNASSTNPKPSPAEVQKNVPVPKEAHKEAPVVQDIEKEAARNLEVQEDGESVKIDASQDNDLSNQKSSSAVGFEEMQQKDSCYAEEKVSETTKEGEEKSDATAVGDVEEKPVSGAESNDGERRYYEANPECYNGASYENYSWAQDIYVLDVQVKVPKGVRRGDQVKVNITKKHLKVEVLQDENWQVLLDGTLMYDLKIGGLTWTLHPDDHVHVELEKGYERYWEALLEGEPKINVREIDCSKPYEDLEEEAQAKLQEMMFDQHQKMLGKPTSKQLKVQEMMKKAWNTENSPFKGQDFDPNLFNV